MMNDVWLKRCDSFPKWQFRLLRKGRARFTDFGHGQKEGEIDGRLEYLKEPYLHYAFSKRMAEWTRRHEGYARLEAEARLSTPLVWKDLFNRHSSRRAIALKLLLTRLPGWPLLRFLWMYVAKLGFLEGKAGAAYCRGIAIYERNVRIRMAERKQGAGRSGHNASCSRENGVKANES